MRHINNAMSRSKNPLFPRQQKTLLNMGENVKLARLRRELSAEQVAERAGIARSTLSAIENGASSVSLENLLKVLSVLGLEGDLENLAGNDEYGRRIQDAKLLHGGKINKRIKK